MFSMEYASLRSSSFSTPGAGIISVTTGVPFVTVPVLSRTIISALPVCSNDVDVLNSMPFFAATPFPTIIATGVASPKAHGQLTTSTDIALVREYPVPEPVNIQTANTTAEIIRTAGTNTPETLSAILAIGALEAALSLTILMICARDVSSPTLTARHLINPERLIVPAETLSPAVLSTGTDSPVRADSSTAQSPSTITPSTGTAPPGLTI